MDKVWIEEVMDKVWIEEISESIRDVVILELRALVM
jgi:hypothetical protein